MFENLANMLKRNKHEDNRTIDDIIQEDYKNSSGIFFIGGKDVYLEKGTKLYGGPHDKIIGNIEELSVGNALLTKDRNSMAYLTKDGDIVYGRHQFIDDFRGGEIDIDGVHVIRAGDGKSVNLYLPNGEIYPEYGGKHEIVEGFMETPEGENVLIAKDDGKYRMYLKDGDIYPFYGKHHDYIREFRKVNGVDMLLAHDSDKYIFWTKDGKAMYPSKEYPDGFIGDLLYVSPYPSILRGAKIKLIDKNGRIVYSGKEDSTYVTDAIKTDDGYLIEINDGKLYINTRGKLDWTIRDGIDNHKKAIKENEKKRLLSKIVSNRFTGAGIALGGTLIMPITYELGAALFLAGISQSLIATEMYQPQPPGGRIEYLVKKGD